MPFTCSICGEESTRICARCTKDACNNHLCDKCLRCSDCCECEVVLSETPRPVIRPVHRPLIVEDEDEQPDVSAEAEQHTPSDANPTLEEAPVGPETEGDV